MTSSWRSAGLAAAVLVVMELFTAGARSEEVSREPTTDDVTPARVESDPKDPCRGQVRDDEAGLDRLQQGVFAGVCTSSRWFDSLFGEGQIDAETYDKTFGRVGVGLAWDKLDELSLDGHFRASIHLPVLGNRFNAVIGRETEDVYLDDTFDDVGFLPGSFSDDKEADWYAGLNYNAVEGANSRFNVGAGVQLKSPLNPFVKARYSYYIHVADNVQLTSRSTVFWENEDGLGVTLALDTDWSIREGQLLRWSNTLTRSETTEGVRWRSRLAFYQALSQLSAMRYEATIRGETDGIEPNLRELKVTYRRSMWRDWFFLETYGGVFWADNEKPARVCDACAMVGIGFELMFGERYSPTNPQATASGDQP
jgi:hypothetical protein